MTIAKSYDSLRLLCLLGMASTLTLMVGCAPKPNPKSVMLMKEAAAWFQDFQSQTQETMKTQGPLDDEQSVSPTEPLEPPIDTYNHSNWVLVEGSELGIDPKNDLTFVLGNSAANQDQQPTKRHIPFRRTRIDASNPERKSNVL